jgi:hypothetical protein
MTENKESKLETLPTLQRVETAREAAQRLLVRNPRFKLAPKSSGPGYVIPGPQQPMRVPTPA